MKYTYKPQGVCSVQFDFDIEDDVIESLNVTGGCNGNLKGISSLIKGMKIDDVIERIEGIECGFKPTSCPDQIARALKAYKSENSL
ncbi:MAG: TIGR03905 family TSCPD domain-containing protein [Erysipelotrichaceae bacterium]|nr:TIGR03905 family TSCPD domain-containing protein [Erysipelotrichaceae bacterium]